MIGSVESEWCGTGDLGFLSAENLFVVGRSKELIILRGENVFPGDVEVAALSASPLLVPGGVAAIGTENAGTELLVVVAERRLTNAVDEDSLRRFVRDRVAAATGHVPERVVFIAPRTLPRTTSGKLRRGEIANLYRSGALTQPHSAAPRTPVKIHEGRFPVGSVDVTEPAFNLDPLPALQHLRTAEPISWQPAAKAILLARFSDNAQAFKHPRAAEPDLSAGWRKISGKIGKNFDPALGLLHHFPFIHEGERHKYLRTTLAKAVAPLRTMRHRSTAT